jgi:hypothetical protein
MKKMKDGEIIEYQPNVSPAERRRMAAEDAALARDRTALARRKNFRVVGGTEAKGPNA